jgi:hypothetical protein
MNFSSMALIGIVRHRSTVLHESTIMHQVCILLASNNVEQFTTSPVGKLLTGTNNTVTISGMKNRYKPATLTYTLYARGIGANVPFVPAYAPDANGDGSVSFILQY